MLFHGQQEREKLGVSIRYEKRMEDGDVQGLYAPDPFLFPGQGCSQVTPPAAETLHLPVSVLSLFLGTFQPVVRV